VTPTLRSLADDGVRLTRMYAYMYCSPTRRALLSGRFPVHISGAQAPVCSDFLPLNFTILSQKLQHAGMESHFLGKGHLGYMTMDHLPVNRGFSSHVGFLYGAENYTKGDSHMNRYWTVDMWEGETPAASELDEIFYSTNFYTERALDIVQNFSRSLAEGTAAKGLWVHLAHQAVHAPITDVPPWERVDAPAFWEPVYAVRPSRAPCCADTINYQLPSNSERLTHLSSCWIHVQNMLHVLDSSVANVTGMLQACGLWSQTLLIASSGGTTRTPHPCYNARVC
jgi:hypothetical protein